MHKDMEWSVNKILLTTRSNFIFRSSCQTVFDFYLQAVKEDIVLKPASLKEALSECITYCKSQNISEPITILKKYQSLIVTGRQLEITEDFLETGVEGETNFILVDRSNLVTTAFDEIKNLKDLRKCLEVQFYGEVGRFIPLIWMCTPVLLTRTQSHIDLCPLSSHSVSKWRLNTTNYD